MREEMKGEMEPGTEGEKYAGRVLEALKVRVEHISSRI